jgi:hypothetical protein
MAFKIFVKKKLLIEKNSIKMKKINKKNKLVNVKEKKFYIKISQILPYIKKIKLTDYKKKINSNKFNFFLQELWFHQGD